ncbi:glycosyltransferase [Leuconostoc mesenteroides]|uniref:glycosyltransferase n=1 Tax=Leuconostoc mesenteroides TaxID=1245 RepID=UPI003888DD3F
MNKYIAGFVTFNRSDKLINAVNSIENQTVKPQKILIVDNASVDDTLKVVEDLKLKHSNIIYLRLSTNIGGAGGFSEVIKAALTLQNEDNDFLLLADDDIVYHENYAENLINIAKQRMDSSVFVGRVVNKLDGTDNKHFTIRKKVSENVFEMKSFTFLGVMLKISLIKKIGLPRADFFIWEDDREYADRINGYSKIIGVYNAEMNHDIPKNNGSITGPDWRSYYGIRNYTMRMRIHKKFPKNYILPIVHYSGYMLMNWIKGRHKGFRLYRTNQLTQGLADGFKGKMGINEKYSPMKLEKKCKKLVRYL